MLWQTNGKYQEQNKTNIRKSHIIRNDSSCATVCVQTVGEYGITQNVLKCVIVCEIANGCETKDFKSVINMHNTSFLLFRMHRKARGSEHK